MKPMDVFCADIGSVRVGNFGWSGQLANREVVEGIEMAALATVIADRLNSGSAVALGFEAPMCVPLRSNPVDLTKRRIGETNPNWIGGPGSAVLATGLAQVPWILRDIRSRVSPEVSATLDWDEFTAGKAGLFLWEAFVSGSAKGQNHVHDARIAVERFRKALPDLPRANAIAELEVMSLLGAALLRTGWCADTAILCDACIVIKA